MRNWLSNSRISAAKTRAKITCKFKTQVRNESNSEAILRKPHQMSKLVSTHLSQICFGFFLIYIFRPLAASSTSYGGSETSLLVGFDPSVFQLLPELEQIPLITSWHEESPARHGPFTGKPENLATFVMAVAKSARIHGTFPKCWNVSHHRHPDMSFERDFPYNPMTWGWDVLTINPTRSGRLSGVLGSLN